MGIFLNDHGLQEEVIKHGSHNQQTHAGSRGGSAGGSGASTDRGPLGDMDDMAAEAKDAVKNMISGAEEKLKIMQASPNKGFEAKIERSKGVIKGYQDASRLIGKPKELSKLKSTMNRAKKDMRLPSNSANDRNYVEGYADAAIQVANLYGELNTGN